jgi:penicillin-binding protein 1A
MRSGVPLRIRLVRASVVALSLSLLLPVLVSGALLAAIALVPPSKQLPAPHPSVSSEITHVVDAAGNQIAAFHRFETSLPVARSDIPKVLDDAAVAIEDRRFWSHGGIDFQATLRAAWEDLVNGNTGEGGSSITQQYVKQTYTGPERTLHRKLREAVLAGRVERSLSKSEILYRYLSQVYLGSGAYGVGAASQSYFHKRVNDLDLGEAALLAGLIQSPSVNDPRVNPAGAEVRRIAVLKAMLDTHKISAAQFQEAAARRVTVVNGPLPAGPATAVYPPPVDDQRFPYFVDYVRRYLEARYGADSLYRGGLRVETSLDPRLQSEAESAVATTLGGTQPPLDMAMVSLDPATGLVQALVGGRDFAKSQVNLALGNCGQAQFLEPAAAHCIDGGGTGRQPGSAFKPFTLAKAFEKGITADRVYTGPGAYTFPNCHGQGCTVHNVESGGYGALTLRQATALSVNTVFAQLVADVGVKDTAELSHRLGITMVDPEGRLPSGEPYGPSLTLGAAEVSPLDMASAYGVFAARGQQAPPSPVLRVVDRKGKVLEDNTHRSPRRVLAEEVADNVTDILKGVLTYGTGRAADIGRPNGTAGKTGTSEDYADAWFVGYTPTRSTAVWMGYADGRRPLVGVKGLSRVFGGTLPAQTWKAFMTQALDGSPPADFAGPAALNGDPLPVVHSGRGGGASTANRRPAAAPTTQATVAPGPLAPIAPIAPSVDAPSHAPLSPTAPP